MSALSSRSASAPLLAVAKRGRLVPRIAAAIARREREVRDVLWLLLTLAWVLAPHALVLPLWVSVSVAALVAWRAWITWRGRRLPHRLLPMVLTCVAGIAVWLQYRTIFGKDAGVAFVVLLLGLKLLEMRTRRDIFVVIFLSLFVMLTALFESQSMAMAGVLLVGLWMLVTALVSAQFAAREPRWRVKATIAARLVAYALPLMAVLFVFFPRIEGPLWGLPSDAYAAKTGLSESMSPGSFARLSESREMAFRAHFTGRVPVPAERYWRGPVLGAFDGRTWTPIAERPRGLDSTTRDVAPALHDIPRNIARNAAHNITVDPASAVDYEVTLEPSNRPWLFTLDILRVRPASNAFITRVRPDLQVVAESLVHDRVLYTARSYTRYRVDANDSRARLQEWLELPPSFNPRTHAFAAQLQAQESRDDKSTNGVIDEARHNRRLIDRVMTMIRAQGFVYTLEPPALGRESVDEFLFDIRRGYCEHYASAFVVLMRALDIPARVVTGYQGGEINPVDGFLEVRQRDAHAWAEVWLPGQGWVRVDPTAAVAPDRIERGAADALGDAQGFAGFVASGSWLSNLLQKTRFNWDAIGNTWNQWILAYNADRQSGLLSGLGIEKIDWQTLTIALIVAFGALLAGIGALTLFSRVKPDPIATLYNQACATLARAARRGAASHTLANASANVPAPDGSSSERRASEGPRAYLARIRDRLPEALRMRADTTIALYEQLRYARHQADAAGAALLGARFAASVAALRV